MKVIVQKKHINLNIVNIHLDDKKEFKGKGNAYGRNRGNMSGKEFGRLRSEEAKNKIKEPIVGASMGTILLMLPRTEKIFAASFPLYKSLTIDVAFTTINPPKKASKNLYIHNS